MKNDHGTTDADISAAREARYNYWNALLTLDGIFISVLSAAIVIGKTSSLSVAILVFASLTSASLIAWNTNAAVRFAEFIGRMTLDDLSEEMIVKHRNTSDQFRFWMRIREFGILWLAIIQAAFVVFVVLEAGFTPPSGEANEHNLPNHCADHCNSKK